MSVMLIIWLFDVPNLKRSNKKIIRKVENMTSKSCLKFNLSNLNFSQLDSLFVKINEMFKSLFHLIYFRAGISGGFSRLSFVFPILLLYLTKASAG